MNLPADWVVPDWPVAPRVRSFVTARGGGVSRGPYATFNVGDRTDDDPADVGENRRRLRALLPAEPRWLTQVHGPRVVHADEVDSPIEADASFTRTPGVVCAVKIADCMPVLITDLAGTVIGAAHAGWRGLSQGVIERTIAAMACPPEHLLAFLGPAIGPDAFEVGDDVLEAFVAADPQATDAFRRSRAGKWTADLFALGRRRLARAGVTRVYGGGLCTYADPARFFSYRRERASGRMVAVIWLAP